MSQFEFETKEQREAWRVIEQLAEANHVLKHIDWIDTVCAFNNAASRFDEREKTCGIEFGSYAYGLLVIAQHVGLNQFNLRMPTLDRFLDSVGILNDEGREVLAQVNANAMCKVEK